jgi:hypothetical protein
MLTLPGALGRLISSFHKSGSWIVASRVGYSERNGCQRSVNVWRSEFGAWRSAFAVVQFAVRAYGFALFASNLLVNRLNC